MCIIYIWNYILLQNEGITHVCGCGEIRKLKKFFIQLNESGSEVTFVLQNFYMQLKDKTSWVWIQFKFVVILLLVNALWYVPISSKSLITWKKSLVRFFYFIICYLGTPHFRTEKLLFLIISLKKSSVWIKNYVIQLFQVRNYLVKFRRSK